MVGSVFDQGLVVQAASHCRLRRHCSFVAHLHPALHGWACWRNRFDQWRKCAVEKHHGVFRVVDDVNQLLREQSGVQGVHHRTHARHRIVNFNMAIAVPGQSGNVFTLLNTQAGQGIGQFLSAFGHFAVGGPMNIAFRAARHNFNMWVVPLCVFHHR